MVFLFASLLRKRFYHFKMQSKMLSQLLNSARSCDVFIPKFKHVFFPVGDYFILITMEKIRSSPPEVFLGKGVLKKYRKFTGEHPCLGVISIKLRNNFIKITLRHGCSPVNLLHIFRTPFPKNTPGWLFLKKFTGNIWQQITYIPLSQNESGNQNSYCRHHKIVM